MTTESEKPTDNMTRDQLVAEIERLESQEQESERLHARSVARFSEANTELAVKLVDAQREAAEVRRRCEILETDVHNLLGTIRVMADRSREVRIRKSTVRDSDIGYAMPQDSSTP